MTWGRGSENVILWATDFLNNPRVKEQQNMRNEENIGHIAQGKRFAASLSLICKIFSANSSFIKVSKKRIGINFFNNELIMNS